MQSPVERATAALRRGDPVLLFDSDSREGETDLVIASQHATPAAIRRLRQDAGGLLCTTVAPEHHRKLGLPFLADLLADAAARHPVLAEMKAHDLRYDPSKSSFGITLNSRRTFTGIPDGDRSLTIQELAAFLGDLERVGPATARERFGAQFRTPGHVILLNGADGGLAARQGHTELSIELARQASLVPSTTICEMLDATGKALSQKDARAYAERHGLVFLTGQDVITAWHHNAARASPPSPAVPA
ncbi:MAG: 3,4-dihydroxy-2-butanone-4-phosphate synthase [bacterium]